MNEANPFPNWTTILKKEKKKYLQSWMTEDSMNEWMDVSVLDDAQQGWKSKAKG